VDTRLHKLERGDCEALVLAAAGLKRLGFASRITSWFPEDEICPAVGQGALALEISTRNAAVKEAVAELDHPATHQAVRAERALLKALGGGCLLPIAAYAKHQFAKLQLTGVVADPAGTQVVRAAAMGDPANPEELGARVASELLEKGARELLNHSESQPR
jgi:hydroxymethylbilane synthase